MSKQSSVNSDEVEKFEETAAQWWDEGGPSAPLHALNPARVEFILNEAERHYPHTPREDLSLIDIGCGGGLVCEPLARLGYKVTGLDAGKTAIDVACNHAADMGLDIRYINAAAEDVEDRFDIVLALEIIEHVDNPSNFVKHVSARLKPGGLIIFSTLNRTASAYALAILGAEYITRKLPIGTHEYAKFITPAELERYCAEAGLVTLKQKGLSFDPLGQRWQISDCLDINYFIVAKTNNSL